jgi:hypothetical protein
VTPVLGGSFATRERLSLRAGPLSLELEDGGLRHVRCGSREVLRGIYVAVRDPSWGTVPGRIEGLRVEARGAGFQVRFVSVHQEGPIEFDWEAVVEGDEAGTIRFEMDGEARSTFRKNRIGICVLYPIDECAGQPCEVERADGEVVRGVFPRFVAPQQPFLGIRALRHEVVPGLRAEVRFLGDVFEMEDQRNWSDASYKTYSPPLALPYPAEIRAGARVRQSVTLTLAGEARPRPVLLTRAEPARVRVDPARPSRLPRIGLGSSTEPHPPTPLEERHLRSLTVDHLRADLHVGSAEAATTLARARETARALGVPLEVALFLSDDAEADLRAVAEMARGLELRVAIWLLFREATSTTSDGLSAQARRFLLPIDEEARLGGGTDGHFAELNRVRPPAAELDQVSFSLNPQVHARDDETLLENLSSLASIAESARAFVGSCPLALSPVTLRPRQKTSAASDREDADPRHALPFGGAWTAALLSAATEAGFASLTLFEPTGPRGLVDGAALHPTFRVLRAFSEMKGGVGLRCTSDDPRRAQALAFHKGPDVRALVFNLSPEPQSVLVAGLPLGAEALSLEGARRAKDASSPLREGYRLDLLPYEVVRLDARG